MKGFQITDLGALRNELAKYQRGKKLPLPQFNQAARLAWLGKAVLSPLDRDDPDCKAWLLYLERPAGLAEHCLAVDEELFESIHVLDADQGAALALILGQGVKERAAGLGELNRRDFYFEHFSGKDER